MMDVLLEEKVFALCRVFLFFFWSVLVELDAYFIFCISLSLNYNFHDGQDTIISDCQGKRWRC